MQMIPTGGVAVEPAEPTVAYVSDKTNPAIWMLNMTTGGQTACSLLCALLSNA
jgi:hypothetical protein